jgi:hypothetical protein
MDSRHNRELSGWFLGRSYGTQSSWLPSTVPGSVHAGRSVCGRVRLKCANTHARIQSLGHSIDGQGEVVISTSKGMQYLSLVRQFVRAVVRPERYFDIDVKNCGPNGKIRYAWGEVSVVDSHIGSQFRVEPGSEPRDCTLTGFYMKLPNRNGYPIIWAASACWCFIADDGSLLVNNDTYQKICVSQRWRNHPVHEACGTTP